MARTLTADPLVRRGRWIALAVLAILVALQWAEALPFQARLRAFLFDAYQEMAPRERSSAPAVIVDIDEASLARFGQWPWPRSLVARLVERVAAADPAAIGLDILMPEPDGASPCVAARYLTGVPADLVDRLCALPGNDALLARALADSHAVLSVAGVDRATGAPLRAAPARTTGGDPIAHLRRFEGALTSVAALHEAAAGHAIVSADTDFGVVRWIPMAASVGGVAVPSLAIEMLRLAARAPAFEIGADEAGVSSVGVGDVRVPTQSDGRLWLHYGPLRGDRYVSAQAVLEGTVDRDRLERRLVLIGVSGLGLVDYPVTALGERVPGVEIHAQALESIFDGTTLLRPAAARSMEAFALLALGLALLFGIARMNSMAAPAGVFGAAAVLLVAGFWLFSRRQILFDAATPALSFLFFFGGLLVWELMRARVARRALESTVRAQREAAARTAGEVAAARRIQLGMVPDARATFAAEPRLDIAARMEPAREVGGDLYDCFMLDRDRAFFLVGDVCGKGIPASLFMATSKTLCKSVALRESGDLGRLMREANREIARDNSEMLFVTVFAGIVDLRSGELCYANAGHERPYLARPGGAAAPIEAASGPPLGIDPDADYPVARRRLAPDEFLCVLTDGIGEAIDAADAFFGKERIVAALAGIDAAADAHAVLDRIVGAVDAFARGAERSDDVTLVVLRWRGTSASAA